MKQCDSDAYPNLSVLLKIAGPIAVTSCKCERSGRVLKRLNTYLRTSMRQERLSRLALMYINYDLEISVYRVMSIFVKKPRALEFSNICSTRFQMLWNCLSIYQKQPLRVVLKNRCSEIYNQNPWTIPMKKFIFSLVAN